MPASSKELEKRLNWLSLALRLTSSCDSWLSRAGSGREEVRSGLRFKESSGSPEISASRDC